MGAYGRVRALSTSGVIAQISLIAIQLLKSDSKMAEVVRIRRCRGELVQGCDVYIGGAVVRGGWDLSVSAWNNPFNAWNSGSQEEACRRYERYL